MSDETTDCSWASSPEVYVRKLAHSWRQFGGGKALAAFLAEYDRRGAERDEALGLLRELVAVGDIFASTDAHSQWTELWKQARALVERVGPADAHPVGTDKESNDG